MIRAVANKRLFLSEEEYEYFVSIKNTLGEDDFRGLFESDIDGYIVAITPPLDRKVSMICVFFLLNIVMNQKLRAVGDGVVRIKEVEERVRKLEEDIANDNS